MADSYTTHNVHLETADFYVLITEFPEEDVNDKLSLLASEKGLIYKTFYEDFVLGNVMANSGPFFYHIKRRPEIMEKFEEVRAEAISLAYKFCPGFKPENIVINSNNILKTRKSVREDETVRLLTDNDLWGKEPPIQSLGPSILASSPKVEEDEDDNPFGDNPFQESDDEEENVPAGTNDPFSGGGENGGVPYTIVGHMWKRLSLHISVKQFEDSEESLLGILGDSPFESSHGYHLLIVAKCIEDFSDIFHLLDVQGITKTTKPSVLVEDLYNVAIIYNPFLKLEDIDLKSIRREYRKRNNLDGGKNNKRMSAGVAPSKRGARKKKKKFSDVPKEKLLSLEEDLKKKIIGQDEAVKTISEAVLRASVGLKRGNEPVGTFLFTGNTGVGKTETAKALATVLGAGMIRIDCQEYQHSHEVAKLTGSPPGYVGYEDGGHLTKDVDKTPFSVVLFDEIEKAHPNFHERILQICDDGILTDNRGNKISFDQTILIMTSNIGVSEVAALGNTVGFGDASLQTYEKTSKARTEALKKKFKPEFLNRIDDVVHFRLLEKDDYLHILDILLEEVKDQLNKAKSMTLAFNVGAKNFLLDKGIDKKFGARPLRRAIKSYLNTPLAIAILKEELTEKIKVVVGLNKEKDGLYFKQTRKKDDAHDTSK